MKGEFAFVTMKKKVDSRIRTLVENSVKTRQRSLFVIVGDKGRDQVWYLCSNFIFGGFPTSVCWNQTNTFCEHFSLYIFIRYHVGKMSVSWMIASRIPEATEFVDDDL